jgi:hypothetical protein
MIGYSQIGEQATTKYLTAQEFAARQRQYQPRPRSDNNLFYRRIKKLIRAIVAALMSGEKLKPIYGH